VIADGIHCLPIPTPFAVGRVNTYLIEDDPLTLVDSGPNSGKALDELERALRERGHAIEDLGLIVVSHQHIDHEGLVDILARRSGAEVAALDPLADWLAAYRDQMQADDEFAEELMRRHGIAEDVGHALRAVSAAFRGWGAAATVTRRLHEGDAIALRDRTMTVHHRPGHSPTDTVFHDADRRVLIGADHLIKHISSNPLITRGHSRALVTYLESLRRTREMDIDLVLTGHGDPVEDHRALIDSRFAMHEKRAAKIARRIGAEGPMTAHAIAQSLWGNVALTQAFLTLSEVLGHVDLLLDRGEVVADEGDDGVVRFRAA
jgi:glyoxylase-like metal-dependent hydrolase (beta-lactamase superfamily II)